MVEKGSILGNLTDKKREAPLYESFCVILRVCARFRVSLRLSASLCVSVRVSLRRLSAYSCAFARLAALSFRVSPCRLPASPKIFPRLSAAVRVSMYRFPRPSAPSLQSPNVFARLSVSFFEPVRHPPASLCIFQRLCASAVFPHLSLAFMISASCFYLSLPLSTYLRVGFPHLFEPFRSSQRRPSTSLSVVVCPIASLLRVSPRLSASL